MPDLPDSPDSGANPVSPGPKRPASDDNLSVTREILALQLMVRRLVSDEPELPRLSRSLQRSILEPGLRPGGHGVFTRIFRGFGFVDVHAQPRFVVGVNMSAPELGQAGKDIQQSRPRPFEFLDHEVGRLGSRPFLHTEIA